MKQQIATMLELQDSMNSKVREDWREQNFEWYRAIWIECAELLDHHGWKWWKKQQPDVNQIALELVVPASIAKIYLLVDFISCNIKKNPPLEGLI